jgi:seryl-tRNA synthetase
MLNLALIRENPDVVRQALAARQTEASLDDLLALDGQRRGLLQQVEALRAERNAAGKEIGRLSQAAERAGRQVLPREKDFSSVEEQDQSARAAREHDDSIARRDELLERMRGVSQQIEALEDELRAWTSA